MENWLSSLFHCSTIPLSRGNDLRIAAGTNQTGDGKHYLEGLRSTKIGKERDRRSIPRRSEDKGGCPSG